MKVLGINLSHDRSAALIQDGKVIVAIAEERLDRIKHSIGYLYKNREEIGPKDLPWRSISYCLNAAKTSLDDLDLVVVDHAGGPVDLTGIKGQIPLKDPNKIRSLPHPSHHLAHAYSAFYASPFSNSAIIVVDHIGSYVEGHGKESESIFFGKDKKLSKIYSHYARGRDLEEGSESLTHIYRMCTLLLGFINQNINFGQKGKWLAMYDDAGKTMGLAPYGRKRDNWEEWVSKGSDGYPTFISLLQWLEEKGLLKIANFPFQNQKDELKLFQPLIRNPLDPLQQIHKDLAFKAQQELEKGMLLLANKAFQETQSENLCLAGGVALNSVANTKILKESPFKKLFIQPASTDDGNAVGAAYYGYYQILEGDARHCWDHPYLGKNYSNQEVEESLQSHFLWLIKKYNNYDKLCQRVATEMAGGKVIAWYQGGSEFGPRALGNRSLLADPRDAKMKDYLNQKIKFREEFRPYAPAVLLEHTKEYFEFEGESPFMLLVANVRKEKQGEIPAVTHVDGTARLQTVSEKANPRFYQLIQHFYEITGIPMVLNTSLNIKGEPIVETPDDAIECFYRSEIDFLVLGDYLISKELYRDDELRHLKPKTLMQPNKDIKDEPQHFLYDVKEQKTYPISKLQFDILNRSNEMETLETMGDQLKVEFSSLTKEVRGLLRRGWLGLFLPN